MVIPTYAAFRAIFALGGASEDNDGLLEFPGIAKLRSGGFTGLATPTIGAFPFTVTCNGGVSDSGFAFDWYLSQRTDMPANQYLTCVQLDNTHSGSVVIDTVDANVAKLLPGVDPSDYTDAANIALILKNCHLYVQRRSDDAYQWIKLYAE